MGRGQGLSPRGAELGFNYLGEALKKRFLPLRIRSSRASSNALDVGDDAQIDGFFAKAEARWGRLDFIVHSIAFANRESLNGISGIPRAPTSISRWIFPPTPSIACARRAARLMGPGGAMVTMSFLGAVRCRSELQREWAWRRLPSKRRPVTSAHDLGPEGIRVNAVSAGPIRTLAASGVGDFRKLMEKSARGALLRKERHAGRGGNATAYLLSDWGFRCDRRSALRRRGVQHRRWRPGVESAATRFLIPLVLIVRRAGNASFPFVKPSSSAFSRMCPFHCLLELLYLRGGPLFKRQRGSSAYSLKKYRWVPEGGQGPP